MDNQIYLRQFGETVREIRKQRNLSQEEFAEKCGLHRTYVGGIERGERNVSLLNIIKMAQALNVTVGDLVKGLRLP
ncbi:MAG: helix-turn-helix transcriptional regulator [bacterium]|nr:helix-turn-helix transcriptional regulator [bacterium]